MDKEKKCITVAVVGHVDSGKSTCAGHLIYRCGCIDNLTVEKCEREAAELGKTQLKYAWIMNRLKVVRERGIGFYIPPIRLETKAYYVTIFDETRDRDFIKNMITTTSQVDCALLVVSAGLGEFEAGISRSGQTRDDILLMYTLDVKQMIVIINKMDVTDSPFSETRFNEIKSILSKYIKDIHYQLENITFIPVSATHGDNMIESSENMSWYKGKTLLEAIDQVILPQQPVDKPLRLPIQNIYTIGGNLIVSVGRVETGTLRNNMKITFAPSNITREVKSIQMNHKNINEALPGDNIGFSVEDISAKELQRGFICSDFNNDPAQETSSFIAQIIVLNHPGRIGQGYTPVLVCHNVRVACKFVELISKMSRQTGRIVEEAPKYIRTGDIAIVKLIPTRPMCIEKFADYPSLGRFAVHDIQRTVAVGIVKDVEKRIPIREKIFGKTISITSNHNQE